MVDFDNCTGLAQRRLLRDLLHRENWAAGYIHRIEGGHDLHLVQGHRPLFNFSEHKVQLWKPRFGCIEFRVFQPFRMADNLGQRRKSLCLSYHIFIGVRIGFPTLASDDPTRMTSSGSIARPRNGRAELAVRILRIFLEHAGTGEPLLVSKLHATEVQHGILHRDAHALSLAALFAMKQGGKDSRYEMNAGAGIADLGARNHRETVDLTGSRGRSAGTLSDILIDLAILKRTRPESLDRGIDHPRIDLLNLHPGKAHAIDRAGIEVFDHHVAFLDELPKDFLARFGLGVQRHAALVAVQHREVKAVGAGNVA